MQKTVIGRLAAAVLAMGVVAACGSGAESADPPSGGTGTETGGGLAVATEADTVDAAPGDGTCADADGACSLRAAVQEADAAGGGTVTLPAGTYTLGIDGIDEDEGATGDLDITSAVTIDGPDATIDAAGLDRALDVLEGGALTLTGVTVTGGSAQGEGMPASGGGIRNAGELTADGATITGNTAVRAGGGIEAVAGSTTELTGVTLSDNETGPGPGNGGGLHITESGTVTVTDSMITGNRAAAEGGGLWNDTMSTMTVTGSTISGNTASGDEATMGGGGLFTVGGELTVRDSEVTDNVADGMAGSGGGALNDDGTLVVENTTFSGNTAVRAGGAIEANIGTTEVSGTTMTGNSTGDSPGNGGGVHLTGAGTVTLDGGEVTGNTAANQGGGLWNSAPGTMTVTGTDVSGNEAPTGQDLYQDGDGTGFTADGEVVPAG